MAWFRVPRSFRAYLILGLLLTVAILAFSTRKMIRADATDSRPTFAFLMTENNQQNSVSSLDVDAYGASQNSPTGSRLDQNNPIVDFHATSVGPSSLSIKSTDAQQYSKPETSSDTIIISPYPSTFVQSETVQQINNSTNSDNIDQTSKIASYLTSNFTFTGRSMRESSRHELEQAEYRKNYVRDMMKHAWHGYATYAWGYNEVKPVSKVPHTDSIFGGEKLGASIVDGIDTLYIMGLQDEYLAARTWIENNLDFNKFDVDLSVFETNIRYVGGLLSIYSLTKDKMFLNKAVQIADKLLPAFETPSGIPYSNVNLRTGYARNHDWAYGAAILSEFGSMHLEFIYLSHVTGDPKYRDKAFRIRHAIKKAVPRQDGLYNNYINTESGQWLTRPTHISMGALGDSFYEYLIKSYVQTDGLDTEAYKMYIDAIKAYENKLIFTSTQSKLVYFAELKDTSVNHKMDSLACFSGGMLALGATRSPEPIRSHHMNLGAGIANTCHESCVRSRSNLGPEAFFFSNRADAVAYGPTEKYYILRPEILETYFYMWRYTHDEKYRNWAWDFVEALERYCKAEAGYSGLRNVYQPVIKDDVQQSFFLAEVLKYLYLIFSDDNVVDLNDWVLNTEAHPFPIIKQHV